MSTVTRTTTRSWGSRLGSSFKGIIGGLIAIVIGVVLLYWNEGRTVKTARGLAEGAQNVVSVEAAAVDPGNDGKLVHFTAAATTDDLLRDEVFNVEVQGLKLRRTVEMFQWEEQTSSRTETRAGGREETVTDYSYRQVWSDRMIDSSRFENPGPHQNPRQFPLEQRTEIASPVSAGAFQLPGRLIERLGGWQALRVDGGAAAPAPVADPAGTTDAIADPDAEGAAGGATPAAAAAADDALPPAADLDEALGLGLGLDDEESETPLPELQELPEAPAAGQPEAGPAPARADGFTPHDGGFYLGTSPSNPAIGDVRVRFEWVPLGPVSVIARQQGANLEPYRTGAGTSIDMISLGEHSAQMMFEQAEAANRLMAWLLRAGGFVLILVGFNLIFAPLGVLADVLPILGRIARMGTGLVSFLLAVPLALVTIAIAWLAARPLMAIALIAVAMVFALGLMRLRGGKTAAPPAEAT